MPIWDFYQVLIPEINHFPIPKKDVQPRTFIQDRQNSTTEAVSRRLLVKTKSTHSFKREIFLKENSLREDFTEITSLRKTLKKTTWERNKNG